MTKTYTPTPEDCYRIAEEVEKYDDLWHEWIRGQFVSDDGFRWPAAVSIGFQLRPTIDSFQNDCICRSQSEKSDAIEELDLLFKKANPLHYKLQPAGWRYYNGCSRYTKSQYAQMWRDCGDYLRKESNGKLWSDAGSMRPYRRCCFGISRRMGRHHTYILVL